PGARPPKRCGLLPLWERRPRREALSLLAGYRLHSPRGRGSHKKQEGSDDGFGLQRIDTAVVMHFLAVERRVEHAGHLHVLAAAAQQVLVVLVEDVQRAGFDLVD